MKTLCLVTQIVFFISLTQSLFAQKTLSLEEAVLQQYGTLYPDYLSQFTWLNDGAYAFVEGNVLQIKKGSKKIT